MKTELTAELIAKMIRRHFGWDKIPEPEEVREFLALVAELVPEVEPCANMDTELMNAIHRATNDMPGQPIDTSTHLLAGFGLGRRSG